MEYYLDTFPGRELTIQDKKYLYFGGTAYLGLQSDVQFQDTLIGNIRKYGTNYSASRNSNIKLSIFDKAENVLAHIVGATSSLLLSSGYLAGQLVAHYFNSPGYKPFYAPRTHSALYAAPITPYTDVNALNRDIRSCLEDDKNNIPVLFMDSLDYQDCNYPKFRGLELLPMNRLILIVDDSHGLGIIGDNGSGAFQELKNRKPKELIVCGSLGKGFGIQAGAVLGTGASIEKLRKTAFFGGASPPAPAHLATFIESQAIYASQRKLLKGNIKLFKDQINALPFFDSVPGHPAFSFQKAELTAYLKSKGILVTNFKYPDNVSPITSRIVLASHHLPKDISVLCEVLNNSGLIKLQ